MLKEFILMNFGTIVIAIVMPVFMKTNRSFEKREERLFLAALFLLDILLVVDNVEWCTSTLSYPTMLRVWMSAIGYTVRPLVILTIILIVLRGRISKLPILILPAVVNAVVAFSALFSDIAYSYDEANEYVRGPLGFTAHIISAVYLVIVLCLTIQFFVEKNVYEGMVVVAIIMSVVMATALETILKMKGLLRLAIGLSIVFYYLYFHTQSFKRDTLTGCLSRRFFYIDADRRQSQITSVVSIDLNNLKVLNDTLGHAEGDKAICTMVACIRRVAPRGCVLYRTGGDEFMMLCFKVKKDVVEKMIEDVCKEMKKTRYSCAIGMVEYHKEETIDNACKRADEMMYENKTRMKA